MPLACWPRVTWTIWPWVWGELLLVERIRRSPVDMVNIPFFTRFPTSQTVVGNGISEPSTVRTTWQSTRTTQQNPWQSPRIRKTQWLLLHVLTFFVLAMNWIQINRNHLGISLEFLILRIWWFSRIADKLTSYVILAIDSFGFCSRPSIGFLKGSIFGTSNVLRGWPFSL